MRYSGLDFLDKQCDLKIFEYTNSYILTTFKIGTRVFSETTHLIHDYNLLLDDVDLLFSKLNKNKKIYIVIKNPLDRFLSAATQLTFEGATKYTAAYSLAKWGNESYFFTNFWSDFVNGGISNPKQIYSDEFSITEFKPVSENREVWKMWLDVIHFNLKLGDSHLSQYHEYCYQNCYKVINHSYDVSIIEDFQLKNVELFRKITDLDLPVKTHQNKKWTEFLNQNLIHDVDEVLPRVSINPFLITERSVEIENYITNEFRYYNKLKELV